MASTTNSGQFGQREDTEEQAREGGKNSPAQFGSPQGADPSEAGKRGAEKQPREAKAEGGRKSRRS